MTLLSMENPLFVSYMIAASIMIVKLMGQGWVTVYRMMKVEGGFLNPEDLQEGPVNRNPRPEQLEPNDYVERSRRIQNNDLENIPAFLACGLVFVAADPSALLGNILLFAFVATRLVHTLAYSTKQSHEVRATFYSIGSIIVIVMAVYTLVVAVA